MKKNGRWWNSLGNDKKWTRGGEGFVPLLRSERGHYIPIEIAELVYEEYGSGQSLESIIRRGGFSVSETISALADIIERERNR